jgi:hypothetical protein
MRMHMRRFTRLTNAFSKKKIENHACAVALHSMYYNFVRLHQTLKVSPVMAAGVTERLWEMVDVVDVLDAFEAKRKRKPKVTFEVEEWKIGGGYYVRATLPDGTVDRIEGFATEGEAGRWIKNEFGGVAPRAAKQTSGQLILFLVPIFPGSLLLRERDPSLRHFQQQDLVCRIAGLLRQAQAFGGQSLTLFDLRQPDSPGENTSKDIIGDLFRENVRHISN